MFKAEKGLEPGYYLKSNHVFNKHFMGVSRKEAMTNWCLYEGNGIITKDCCLMFYDGDSEVKVR